MESYQGSQNNNPSGIWQSKWALKLDDILFHFSQFDTMVAWNDMVDLKTILPPDVEEDVEELFKETEKIVFKPIICSTVMQQAEKAKRQHRENVVLPAERILLTAIKKSLFQSQNVNIEILRGTNNLVGCILILAQ
jgi:rRNA-processing protein FCF1